MIYITNRFMISSEKFIRTNFGPTGWEKAKQAMNSDTRAFFERKINPKKTVDFIKVSDVLEVVHKLFEEEKPKVLFELGFHNSEDDLSVTQRLLMKLISVEWVLKVAAMLWKQRVQKGGEIIIRRVGKGHVSATVRNFSMPNDPWWSYLAGWFTCAITFSGGKNVKVEWIGGGKTSSDPAEYDASWS